MFRLTNSSFKKMWSSIKGIINKSSFSSKRNNFTLYNHQSNINMYSYIQPKREWQSMRRSPSSHIPYMWALSNEVILTESKLSLEYWEKTNNPETNSNGW